MANSELSSAPGDPLLIDLSQETKRLCDFLRDELVHPPRSRGYLVGISGGIDSAVAASLCARATGAHRVLAVLLPERESQPDGVELARDTVSHLGLDAVEIDITPSLEALGVYGGREEVIRELFGDFDPRWRYRLVLPGDLRQSRALNVYRVELILPDGSRRSKRPDAASLRKLQALTNVKQRLRMLQLYREAESRGLLVCGTTNRSELALGFFVQYGDGGVDLEPLAGLYKTQIRALARHLQLPAAVIERPPSPDTWSAPVSDEEFYLRMDYSRLDAVLARVERGEASISIAEALSMAPAEVDHIRQEIERRWQATARHRALPPSPSWVPAFPAGWVGAGSDGP